MKLNLNTIKTRIQDAKTGLEIIKVCLEPTVTKYKEVTKEKGIKASLKQLEEENPAVANQVYAVKQIVKAVAKASVADKVLIAKEMKDVFVYSRTASPLNNRPKEMGMHKGLEVKSCNNTVFYSMGTLPHQPAAALVKPPLGDVFILVNDGFYQMSEEHQLAILDHEYGHYIYNHLDQSQGARNFDHELEADAYSASLGNDMIGALGALGANNALARNQEEIALRIKALS